MTKVSTWLLVALVLVAAPVFSQDAQILVSAAASLTDVLTALAPDAQEAVGAKIQLNFGASGTLRKQIEEGAPVDVFFSAASADMDKLEGAGLIVAGTRRSLLSNSLVLVGAPDAAPAASVAELRALLSAARILAIGNPDSVPAGRYASEALDRLGLAPLVKGKLVLAGNVREVLQYVQSGSAPLGIVFSTDALSAGTGVRTIYAFGRDAVKTPVVYPIAVVSASKSRGASTRFIDFLQAPAAREAFRKAGFTFP